MTIDTGLLTITQLVAMNNVSDADGVSASGMQIVLLWQQYYSFTFANFVDANMR